MAGRKPVSLYGLLLLTAAVASAESVEILRDEYGVPHIFASTPAGAAYAAGYVQADDRLNALLHNLHGEERVELASPVKEIAEAFAAGVNRYIEDHPEVQAARVGAWQVIAYSRLAFQTIRGSNDFILGPARTSADGVIAALDPLGDWGGDGRPYEMRLYIAEGDIALSGVAPVGVPFPLVGHSRRVAIGWSGGSFPAGPRALEEAWAAITARSLAEAQTALYMNQIPGDVVVGTADGEIFDSAGRPAKGSPWESDYVMRTRGHAQADAMVRKLLAGQIKWSPARVAEVAFATDVYKAETWQSRLSKTDPGMPLVRLITGWNRRADAASIPALAFYLFKMELGRDAGELEPPDSLSDGRIRAALDRAKDRLELGFAYGANWGTLFRGVRDGARESHAMSGGTAAEAGMATPRAIVFERRGAVNMGVAGQVATQIVALGKTVDSRSVLMPGESDLPNSPHFDDQARTLFGRGQTKPTYFGDRRDLERHATSKIELKF